MRRVGRKGQPAYRIVVAERTEARDGRVIETIGHYDPRKDPMELGLDVDKARLWLERGATTSETVRSLFKRAGVFKTEVAPAAPLAASGSPDE
ncbi:MAG: 30S ribosomal protein S16 [Gemmatimonadales bacterium]